MMRAINLRGMIAKDVNLVLLSCSPKSELLENGDRTEQVRGMSSQDVYDGDLIESPNNRIVSLYVRVLVFADASSFMP